MLVLIGATAEGKKELVAAGVWESAQSWGKLLINIERRGLEIAPVSSSATALTPSTTFDN
jgi:hypothetical protein